MGIWDALEIMDGLFDLSDPDVKTSQAIHAFQTAEAVRRDGQPRWLILTALVHDLGKLLYFLGEPQWTVRCASRNVLLLSYPLIRFWLKGRG